MYKRQVQIGNDWDELLKDEFQKEYYQKLRVFLAREYKTQTIYPGMYDIFNALRYTACLLYTSRMSSKEKQELEHMEEDIAALQEQLEHLDIEMNAAGDDFKKIQELADQRDILEQSIEEKMERWMFLEDKKQEIENAKGK